MKRGKFSQGEPRSRQALVILLIIVLLFTGGIALGLSRNRQAASEASTPRETFTPDLDPSAKKWPGETLPDQADGEPVGIKIPSYPSVTIPANTKDVTVALLNPEGNPCYFTFTLVLKDTGETLYTSGMVAPGDVITDITLSHPLEAGEYDATIQITTAALTDGRALNGANVETVLVVQ